MKPLNFIVIGSGWRSLFFGRLAACYPEYFKLSALLCRTEEKAQKLRIQEGVPATASKEDCEASRPDFVVVAVDRDSIFEVTKEWVSKGYPVLCETPAAVKLEDLTALWNLHTEHGAKIQVAEQYFSYPSYAAAIEVAKRGYLGTPYMVNISALHEYHAASIIRRILDTGFENMKVSGKKYTYPVVETDSRYGLIEDGRIGESDRVRVTFEFENGKTAFYDFSGVQYHSKIRSRHLNIQGERGELDDWTVRYVGEDNRAREEVMEMEYFDSNQGIKAVMLGKEQLYENPFAAMGQEFGMPQDETAIASLMFGMKRFIEEDVEVYPLAEGLQDAYVRILMEAALGSGETVTSETQVWSTIK